MQNSGATPQLLESAEDELESIQAAVFEEFREEWRFFSPSASVAESIFQLNDKLGSEYFGKEYEKLIAVEGGGPEDEEIIQDDNWFRWLFQQVSAVLSHGQEERQYHKRAEDEHEFFQKFISERIFNHFAMLARSPHAKQGKAFSISEELTKNMTEKLGLGLCVQQKTSHDLRVTGELVLLQLAREFQRWFLEEKKGVFVTSWGIVGDPLSETVIKAADSHSLILEPDVQMSDTYYTAR